MASLQTISEEAKRVGRFNIDEFKKDPREYAKILADCEKMEAELAKPKINAHEVQLSLEYDTKFGERVAAVGGCDFMGNWDMNSSFNLEWSPGNIWRRSHIFEAEPYPFEYKFVIVGENQRWEPGANRAFICEGGVQEDNKIVYKLEGKWQRVS
jgi:hypothetical protein